MSKSKPLVYSAVSLALACVLSMVKLIDMPLGGAVTLCSMLFVCLPGYLFGLGYGFMTSIAYGILQFVFNGYVVSVPQVLCDYLFAFGALGLSGFFRKGRFALPIGYTVGVLGRFFFSFLSGVLFFGQYAADYGMTAVPYSFLYNGAYIGLEGFLTLLILFAPAALKGLERVKVDAESSVNERRSVKSAKADQTAGNVSLSEREVDSPTE